MNVQHALNGTFMTIEFDAHEHSDLEYCLERVREILLRCIREVNCVKFYVLAEAHIQKNVEVNNTTTFGFHSKTRIILRDSNIDDILRECKLKILDSLDNFQRKGSGKYEFVTTIYLNIKFEVLSNRKDSDFYNVQFSSYNYIIFL